MLHIARRLFQAPHSNHLPSIALQTRIPSFKEVHQFSTAHFSTQSSAKNIELLNHSIRERNLENFQKHLNKIPLADIKELNVLDYSLYLATNEQIRFSNRNSPDFILALLEKGANPKYSYKTWVFADKISAHLKELDFTKMDVKDKLTWKAIVDLTYFNSSK